MEPSGPVQASNGTALPLPYHRNWMEVIGRINTKADLRPGIWPLVPIEYKAGWASVSV